MPICPRHEPHFSPPIRHISPPTDPICVLYMNSLLSNNEYHCNNNGAKRSSSWPGTSIWPLSLEKISKRGAKKVEDQPSPNLLFKPQDDLVS